MSERAWDLTDPRTAERFIRNAIDAQENGYDLLCAECGVGITDDTDMHDIGCSQRPEGGYGLR